MPVTAFMSNRPQQPRFVPLPVRVQALAVPEMAVPVAGLGHVPVPVAVWRVAVLAEAGVIVEPAVATWSKHSGDRNAWAIHPASPAGRDSRSRRWWPRRRGSGTTGPHRGAVGSCPARCGASAPTGRAAGPELPARSGWPGLRRPRTAELPSSPGPSPAPAVPGHGSGSDPGADPRRLPGQLACEVPVPPSAGAAGYVAWAGDRSSFCSIRFSPGHIAASHDGRTHEGPPPADRPPRATRRAGCSTRSGARHG